MLPAVWCGNHWKARLSDVQRLYPLLGGDDAPAAAASTDRDRLVDEIVDAAPELSPERAARIARRIVGGASV